MIMTVLILTPAWLRHFLYILHSVQVFPFLFLVEFTNSRFDLSGF